MSQRLLTSCTVMMLGLAVVAIETALLGSAEGLGYSWGPLGAWRRACIGDQSVDTADFNHDGNADLIVAHDSLVELRLANKSGDLGPPTVRRHGGEGNIPKVVARDFNDDGHSDVAVSYDQSGDVWLFLGDGRGGLSRGQPIKTAGSPFALTAADVDGDGRLDIVATLRGAAESSELGRVQVLHNDGGSHFTPLTRQ